MSNLNNSFMFNTSSTTDDSIIFYGQNLFSCLFLDNLLFDLNYERKSPHFIRLFMKIYGTFPNELNL
jgi:hypothetical protein